MDGTCWERVMGMPTTCPQHVHKEEVHPAGQEALLNVGKLPVDWEKAEYSDWGQLKSDASWDTKRSLSADVWNVHADYVTQNNIQSVQANIIGNHWFAPCQTSGCNYVWSENKNVTFLFTDIKVTF